jgi:hypothetical protein
MKKKVKQADSSPAGAEKSKVETVENDVASEKKSSRAKARRERKKKGRFAIRRKDGA